MILAIDAGNTSVVIGCIDNGKIIFSGRLTTDYRKTDLEFAVILKNILTLNNIDFTNFDGAIVSSVVPPINSALKKAIKLVTGHEAYFVKDQEGLVIDIDDPKQLGKDIIVGAVTALSEYTPPLALIDMGTATTIFVVDKRNAIVGGAIVPGVQISQDALSKNTSQLPSISFDAPTSVIGKNTIDSMQAGAVFGNAAMLDGIIDRIESELGETVTSIATGGLSSAIIPHCRHEIIYDENLLLKGLWLIYKKRFM